MRNGKLHKHWLIKRWTLVSIKFLSQVRALGGRTWLLEACKTKINMLSFCNCGMRFCTRGKSAVWGKLQLVFLQSIHVAWSLVSSSLAQSSAATLWLSLGFNDKFNCCFLCMFRLLSPLSKVKSPWLITRPPHSIKTCQGWPIDTHWFTPAR